ncbi:hypothetical protein GBA52_028460 [Prunus armeniaca]|nr:hypothetical protein GBA52_028460 [Prunus armeniaca]
MRLQLQARPLFRTDVFTYAYLPLVKICPLLVLEASSGLPLPSNTTKRAFCYEGVPTQPRVCALGVSLELLEFFKSAGNSFLEELNLADNANLSISESSLAVSVSKEVNPAQQGSATRLELGDSADDEVRVEAAASGIDDSCVSICQKKILVC